MKILHVIAIDGFGGAEKLLLQLLPALQTRDDVNVECLVIHREGNESAALTCGAELIQSGIAVRYGTYKKAIDKSLLALILESIHAGGYDFIHSHLRYADLWLALLKRSGKLHLPVISTVHGFRDDYQNRHGLQFRRSVFFSIYYWITRSIYRRFDGFIFNSKAVKDFYRKTSIIVNKRSAIVHNGYDVNGVTRKQRAFRIITTPQLALPGRLVKVKGHVYAIRAMKLLLKDFPGAKLHIYGNGPDEKGLKELTENLGLTDNVQFYGYVNDIPERLAKCDLALIPSIGESFGIVFLDCFAAGIPVIAFDLPAGNEIIQDNFNGKLVKPFDVNGLAQSVTDLCNDPGSQARITENAYLKLRESFSIEMMAGKYFEFYEQFV